MVIPDTAIAAAEGAADGGTAAAEGAAEAAARGAPELGGFAQGISGDEIAAVNGGFGGTTELTGSVDTVLANASRQSGFFNKAASIIRDIAGRHLFDDANKRTAQAVVEALLERNGVMSGVDSATLRSVISRVASRQLSSIEDIAAALRGYR
jgi:death-on-curing family protein